MKPKKVSKKLSLNKTTVANLFRGVMRNIRGGALPVDPTALDLCEPVTLSCDTCDFTCAQTCQATCDDNSCVVCPPPVTSPCKTFEPYCL